MDKIKQFLTIRNIFIVAGIVVLIEVIWSVWVLTKPSPLGVPIVENPISKNTQVVESKITTLSLLPDKASLKKGEKLSVNINASSIVNSIGVDLVISYDPKLLTVSTTKAGPVKTGTIFKDYPLNRLDDKNGKITISGITDVKDGVLAEGLFGSIDFVAKASGKAMISLDFTPGNTADSNITDVKTGKDVLQKVENTQIEILP